jgi:hypothetical protein
LVRFCVLTLSVINHIKPVEQLMQLIADVIPRQSAVNAELRGCGILPEAAAKPDLSGKVANTIEQHAVVMLVITFDQH